MVPGAITTLRTPATMTVTARSSMKSAVHSMSVRTNPRFSMPDMGLVLTFRRGHSRRVQATVLSSGMLDFQRSCAHGFHKARVVALGLIGIRDGKVGDGLVESVGLAEISADLSRLARA